MRYAVVLRREAHMSEAISASDAVFYPIVYWATDLKARGKMVAGALLDSGARDGQPDGFLILSVEGPAEAEEILRSWPVMDLVHLDLLSVVGNF